MEADARAARDCARGWAALSRACIIGAATIAFASSPVIAQKKVERKIPLGMEGALRIVNMVGSIVVHGWGKDTVMVRGTLGAGDNFYMGGGYTGAKMFVEAVNDRDPKPARLEVWVPARVRLWVKTATADIDCHRESARAECRSDRRRYSHRGLTALGQSQECHRNDRLQGRELGCGILHRERSSESRWWSLRAHQDRNCDREHQLLGPAGQKRHVRFRYTQRNHRYSDSGQDGRVIFGGDNRWRYHQQRFEQQSDTRPVRPRSGADDGYEWRWGKGVGANLQGSSDLEENELKSF